LLYSHLVRQLPAVVPILQESTCSRVKFPKVAVILIDTRHGRRSITQTRSTGGFQDRGAAVFGLSARLPSLKTQIKVKDH